jgi:hypothetical protein
MKKIIILLACLFIFVPQASSYTTTDNQSRSSWNETFYGSQNNTIWFNLSKNHYIASAVLNVSGFSFYGFLMGNNTNVGISSSTPTYVKAKNLTTNTTGSHNITFTLTNTQWYGYGKIYKNGVAVGSEHIVGSQFGDSGTFSDIITFNAGDNIELWMHSQQSGVDTTYNDLFRIEIIYNISNPYIDTANSGGLFEWNYTGNFSSNIGSRQADLNPTLINNYLYSCTPDIAGYCTVPIIIHSDTPGIINISGIYIHHASLNITVYDETAPTTKIYSNITITNTTTTLTYTNVTSINVLDTDITGSVTITANDYDGNYAQRQITETITDNLIYRNIYLIQSALSFQIDINVYDSLSTGISGALVNISRQSGYVYNYVTECTTDSAGYCFVTLNDSASYKFVVSKTNYVTKTSYITPTLTAYSFTLQTPTPTINFTSELGGVTMLLTPQITALKKSDAQPFNFTITSNETLTSWGMQILWQNYTGTSLFTSTQSTATGGSVNATINTTLYNGTVIVRTFLQRDGYALRNYYTNYSIYTITPYNHSLYNLIPDVQTNYGGTFSNLFITLALLLFIVFAAALFGLGTEVSGALLFVGLGYLSFFGLIPFNLFLLAMILFMSYVLWKG